MSARAILPHLAIQRLFDKRPTTPASSPPALAYPPVAPPPTKASKAANTPARPPPSISVPFLLEVPTAPLFLDDVSPSVEPLQRCPWPFSFPLTIKEISARTPFDAVLLLPLLMWLAVACYFAGVRKPSSVRASIPRLVVAPRRRAAIIMGTPSKFISNKEDAHARGRLSPDSVLGTPEPCPPLLELAEDVTPCSPDGLVGEAEAAPVATPVAQPMTSEVGTLSKRELYAAMANAGVSLTPSEQLCVWRRLDTNHNGRVEIDEASTLFKAFLKADEPPPASSQPRSSMAPPPESPGWVQQRKKRVSKGHDEVAGPTARILGANKAKGATIATRDAAASQRLVRIAEVLGNTEML